ncbi:Aste57867_10159 [Aphanomyces stellatus]|uniref:Aste57867_10159 protein n=1 Tax=Aphanomyces stellatus TaxID=120398 RepID=A0A485KQ55_9STRA|nr:hypothetical protein As57867_010120 [Aphanomyces stellatus]VFT87035.1 Aste57867_10159 [Aphanomyces stellatus]
MRPMYLREKNPTFMAVMRALHAIIGTATVVTMMQAYGTFRLEDSDMYRYAQTYHFCVVVVGYTALQFGAWYCIFVSCMKRMDVDDVIERTLDVVLLVASLVCGYLTNLKTSCPELVAKETYGRCSNLQVTMILLFVNAFIFCLLLVYGMLAGIPSHPDNTQNLVPRGNYGCSVGTPLPASAIPAHVGGRGSHQNRQSVPMLSPLWDVMSTVDKAPTNDEDKTANIVARGQFGQVKIDDVDKTDKLLPRGNFGSLAQPPV